MFTAIVITLLVVAILYFLVFMGDIGKVTLCNLAAINPRLVKWSYKTLYEMTQQNDSDGWSPGKGAVLKHLRNPKLIKYHQDHRSH